MSISHIAGEATMFIVGEGGSVTTAESGRTVIFLPEPWIFIQGTWSCAKFPKVAVINGGGIPLVIDLNLAEEGWTLAAAANGVRQSVGDAKAETKNPIEKIEKALARAQALAPGLATNWGRAERVPAPIDPIQAAVLVVLSGKLARFGKDAPRLKGTVPEMLQAFREFGESKKGQKFTDEAWGLIEKKVRDDAAAMVAQSNAIEDVFGS